MGAADAVTDNESEEYKVELTNWDLNWIKI